MDEFDTRIVRLVVTLDYVEPLVQRVVDVPLRLDFFRLERLIKRVMPWGSDHLSGFYPMRRGRVVRNIADYFDLRDESGVTLQQAMHDLDTNQFQYLYDFGDSWQHTIKVSRARRRDPAAIYPILVEATGRCPPEDCGGPWGFGELVEALTDPEHPEHAEHRERWGKAFDPKIADVPKLKRAVDELAKLWSREERAIFGKVRRA